jgi:transposase
MTKITKKHSPEFKAKVALTAIRGEKTIAEISAQYGVHASAIHKWKRKLLDAAMEVFADGNNLGKPDALSEAVIADLYEKIGQLTVERDFLSKRSGL